MRRSLAGYALARTVFAFCQFPLLDSRALHHHHPYHGLDAGAADAWLSCFSSSIRLSTSAVGILSRREQ